MQNIEMMILWYLAAYFVVTGIGILHTVFNIVVLHKKSMKDSPGMGEAYEATKPWHPLYNIVIFPIFAAIYFSSLETATWTDAVLTALVWGTATVVIDVFGWVLIKHPWSLSFKEFYVDYQPWITLIYLAIYASPLIAYALLMLLAQ